MNITERISIWLSGYRPESVSGDAAEDRQVISLLGAGVLIAAAVACFGWGTAGWMFSTGSEPGVRILTASISGLTGLAIVLLLDRAFIYLSDTHDGGGRSIGYLVMRLAVILLVHSMTAAAFAPKLLGDEIRQHGLQLFEKGQKERAAELRKQFDLEALERNRQVNARQAEQAQSTAANPPAALLQAEAKNASCWRGYNRERARLLARNFTYEEMLDELAKERAQCRALQRTSRAARAEFEQSTQAAIEQSDLALQAAEAAASAAQSEVDTRLQRAAELEQSMLSPLNAMVLRDLLRSSPAAAIKYFGVLAFLMVLELLPLLIKWQAGRTVPGERVSLERGARRLFARRMATMREREHAAALAVNEAIHSAMNDPLVRESVEKAMVQALQAMDPTDLIELVSRIGSGSDQSTSDHYRGLAELLRQAIGKASAAPQAEGPQDESQDESHAEPQAKESPPARAGEEAAQTV